MRQSAFNAHLLVALPALPLTAEVDLMLLHTNCSAFLCMSLVILQGSRKAAWHPQVHVLWHQRVIRENTYFLKPIFCSVAP